MLVFTEREVHPMPNRYQIVFYTHETGHDEGREFPTINDCLKEITTLRNWCRMLDSDTTEIPFCGPDPVYFEWGIYDLRLKCWRKSSLRFPIPA